MLSPALSNINGNIIGVEDCVAENQFWANELMGDCNKTFFESLNKRKERWLVIDISEMKTNLVKIRNIETGLITYLTDTVTLENSISKLKEHNKLKGCKLEKQDILLLDDFIIKSYLEKYVAKLKEYYFANKIILVEVYNCFDYLDGDKFSFFYNKIRFEKENILLKKCFKWLTELLPDSYIINMPKYVYGNPNHKWGIGSRHFDDKYYDYALKAVNIIVAPDVIDKNKELNRLYEIYNTWFLKIRQKINNEI